MTDGHTEKLYDSLTSLTDAGDEFRETQREREKERHRERERERERERPPSAKDGSCLFNSIGNYTTGGMIMTASL